MNYFFIILGIVGFALAISAYVRVEKLEEILKEKGIIPKNRK